MTIPERRDQLSAILTTDSFDALAVDPATITLANASVAAHADGRPMANAVDVNGRAMVGFDKNRLNSLLGIRGAICQHIECRARGELCTLRDARSR